MKTLHIAASGLPLIVIVLTAAAACSKSSPSNPSSNPVQQTETFTRTARANGPGSCSGDAHSFSAAPGTISVTLVQTTPAESMTVQICSVSSSTDCTLARRRIDVGQTIEAPRNGLVQQSLSLLPLTCGTNAPPSPQPIAYVATVKYLR
jgi:hypothetical protein